MRPSYLAREQWIVIGDIRLRVALAVLEFNFHTQSKLLDGKHIPINTQEVADPFGL